MSSLRLRGGRVIDPTNDPTNGSSADVRDVGVRDGRIVALAPQEPVDEEVDATGCVVMAGGIDMHTHIGGGKVNLSRLLLPEMQRNGANPYALPDNLLELASCNGCTPGTLATGYRYVEMGYTAAFEPAMVFSNARQAHLEMGDIPILDHGAYVMLGNEDLLLHWLAEDAPPERIRDYVGWAINASKALGVKVVTS
jgi:formylmethanofuran dehydrogenase subunit A